MEIVMCGFYGLQHVCQNWSHPKLECSVTEFGFTDFIWPALSHVIKKKTTPKHFPISKDKGIVILNICRWKKQSCRLPDLVSP